MTTNHVIDNLWKLPKREKVALRDLEWRRQYLYLWLEKVLVERPWAPVVLSRTHSYRFGSIDHLWPFRPSLI